MVRHTLSAAALVVLLAAAGCSFSSTQDNQEEQPGALTKALTLTTIDSSHVDLSAVDRGNYADLFEGQQRLIRTQSDFEEFWNRVHADASRRPDVPEIDFSKKIIAAVILGERRTGGYAVEISRATMDRPPPRLRIHVTEYEPGSNCFVSQALTSPYHVVEMDAVDPDTNVEFVDGGTQTRSCN